MTVNKFSSRIPSLDGLRAISITLVLFAHLCGTITFPFTHEFFNAGNMGVRVFFIISGFLITGILLGEIEKTGTINLRKFYYRRTLRIFPAYYFFLLIVGILASREILNLPFSEWLSAALYSSNLTTISTWEIGHTWSLAVEEQFYLLMPGLLLFGKRRAFFVLCAIVLVCPVVRLGTFMLFPDPDLRWIGFGFQANADSLAIGCLLAFLREKLWQKDLYKRFLSSKLFVLLPVAAVCLNYFGDHPKIYFLICITLINVCIALCIDWAVTFHNSFIGKILNTRPLVYVGTLSYSIYLWQQLFLNRQSLKSVNSFPLSLVLAVLCAVVSYYLVEKPALAFRQSFEEGFVILSITELNIDLD